jgi:hypothetical protein
VETGKPVRRINWGNVHPARGSFTPDSNHAVRAGEGIIRMFRLPAREQGESDQPVAPAQPAAAKP